MPNSFDMFISPDGEYITAELYDLNQDPSKLEKAHQREVARSLSDGAVMLAAGTSPETASVVVFEDFQCPYCRTFNSQVLSNLERDRDRNYSIYYRAFPLPFHSWASPAARSVACAGNQNSTYVSEAANFLYEHQPQISAATLRSQLQTFLQTLPGFKIAAFQSCLTDGTGEALVKRDIALGSSLGITGTPSTFVNGHLIAGAVSLKTVMNLLDRAQETSSASHSNEAAPKPVSGSREAPTSLQ